MKSASEQTTLTTGTKTLTASLKASQMWVAKSGSCWPNMERSAKFAIALGLLPQAYHEEFMLACSDRLGAQLQARIRRPEQDDYVGHVPGTRILPPTLQTDRRSVRLGCSAVYK